MDATHIQEYRVRDLPTRSITLFPTRAQVVRDIRNVILKPGLNQISVVGLTPTVDEHSIKVEGTGSAVISDISVELLENTEIFEEIYPASDKDDSDESDDEGSEDVSAKNSDDEALPPAKKELKAVQEKIVAVQDDIKREDEIISSAEKRLVLLEEYGKKFEPKSGADVGEIVDVYDAQRRKTFQDHMDATIRRRKLQSEVSDLQQTSNKLQAQIQKEDKKHIKATRKEAEAKRKKAQLQMARLQKKQKEETRIHNERCKFWPRSCYTVRITLDATHYTPVSSRRSSVSSVTDLVKPVVDEPADLASPGADAPSPSCNISLSYNTSAAFWSPSYDLQLNTTANTGTLFFDAQLTNNTSETWKDCKIILSTSQAVFAGLQDNIPRLVPWRIKLAGRYGGANTGDITNSTEEVEQRRKNQNVSTFTSQDKHGANLIGLPGPGMMKPIIRSNIQMKKGALFGSAMPNPFGAHSMAVSHDQPQLQDYQQQLQLLEQQNQRRQMLAQQQQQMQMQMQQQQQQQQQLNQLMHQMQPQQPPNPPTAGGLFGSSNRGGFGSSTGGGLFGSASNRPVPPTPAPAAAPAASLFGQRASSDAAAAPTTSVFGQPASSNAVPPPPSAAAAAMGDFSMDFANPLDTKDVLADFDFDSFLHSEEAAVEETGMTTTYDLPGTKTLAPSSNSSKQRVARILFANVAFSHTVVAKYRPAAFLKARLRNASKLSLLRGPVGLTLDGTFMGRSTLPRCTSGDSFTMSLGVDPTIRVIYPKPDVKRSSSGVFSKENSTGYRRSVTITNTRGASSPSSSTSQAGGDSGSASKPVHLIVLDQVPVSEDDKLRIDIAHPRGLSEGGSGVSAGVQQEAPKDGGKGWGKAVATLKKGGEVSWDVELHAGKSVKLDLEYEVSLPAGDVAVQSSDTSK